MLDDLDKKDVIQLQDNIYSKHNYPVLDFTWDEYKSFWKPWRMALILKVLGKKFSFKLIEPRITKLWNLASGCKLVDLDGEYMVARFFTKDDYLKVLTGVPWTVMGHYLTISKWRPNFDSSSHHSSTTLAWVRIPKFPL